VSINPIKSMSFRLLDRVLGDRASSDLRGLLFPWYQPEIVASQRTSLIISRVRFIAALFALLTPLWIVLDMMFFPPGTYLKLATARLAAAVAFGALALLYHKSDRLRDAYIALALMFMIPTLFFVYSHMLFTSSGAQLTGFTASLVTGYAFLPFIMAAGLSVFPLTALEGLIFALPALFAELLSSAFGSSFISQDAHLGMIWLFALIATIAILAGMSQLHYLSEIVIKSSHDPLTGAFTRGAGEELLEKYYLMARRNNIPLTLIFMDLDNFKSVNDTYGHEAGDEVLRNAAQAILQQIRKEDLLVRWGGEEFLLVLPHADGKDPASTMKRLGSHGIGLRPDGTPLTASLGQAEYLRDRPRDLAEFIDIADRRMYRAKSSGKNRLCYGEDPSELTVDWAPGAS